MSADPLLDMHEQVVGNSCPVPEGENVVLVWFGSLGERFGRACRMQVPLTRRGRTSFSAFTG